MSKIGIDEYDPEAGMSDSDWIKEKADQEDGCQVSVGGLTGSLSDAEMVRAAAEQCMGWTEYDKEGYPWWADQNGPRTPRLWDPLTSDSECWQLVDKLIADGRIRGVALWFGCNLWEALLYPLKKPSVAPSRLRALVIACLRACGVKA